MAETDLRKLGKYEIRRELGKGAMGVVYEALDPYIERRVALKTIRKDLLDQAESADAISRFRREAQAAGRLTHPNIVAIYEYGEDADVAFIAMEFVEGRELKSFNDARERFELPDILRIMNQLLQALDYSHEQGVVHRDIKPANVMMLGDLKVKVADFGIARIESSTLTQAGTVLGTPSYMSPEQFLGQTVDRRSDIYSAGVILYELLTGEKPFTGALATIMHKVLKEEPLPPSDLNVQLPQALDGVVRKAMAKRPDDRYATAGEFAAALAQAIAKPAPAPDLEATLLNFDPETTLPGKAKPADIDATVMHQHTPEATVVSPPVVAPGAAVHAPEQTVVAAPSEHLPVPRKSKLPLVAAALVVAGLLAGGGWWMWSPSAEKPLAPAAEAVPEKSTSAQGPAIPKASDPNSIIISALGLADTTDPQYQTDKPKLEADAREDARRQLVEKAVALYVDRSSLVQNYDLIREKLLPRNQQFVKAVIREDKPFVGKDGLMYVRTSAEVRVREVQKSLNEMSRDERIDFIRNNGDPKISVTIAIRDADRAGNPEAQRSQVAENVVKDRIKSFGFRTWSEEAPSANAKAADFIVVGEARFKKLEARLPASGLVISKVALTSWTVKCTDRQTGEEIYFNNKLPTATWKDEDTALQEIGKLVGEEFSRDLFLQHFNNAARSVKLSLQGAPNKVVADQLGQEFLAMRPVLAADWSGSGSRFQYQLQLAGSEATPDLVRKSLLEPINRKLGKPCLALAGVNGDEVAIDFLPACADAAVVGLFDSAPPAALMDAPPTRQKGVVRNPDTLKKLQI